MAEKKLKSITGWTYYDTGNNFNKFISSYREFSSEGKLLEETEYMAEDQIETKITYAYDDEGRLKEQVNYYAADTPAEVTYYKYDDDGRLMQEEVHYPDDSKMIKSFAFYPDSNSEAITTMDENHTVEEKEIKRYDEQNRLIAQESYDGKNKLQEKTVFAYNDQSQLIEETTLTKKGKVRSKKQFSYDEAGNRTEIKTINKKGRVVDLLKTQYDDQNRRLEITNGPGNLLQYEYEDSKRIVKVKEIMNGRQEGERIYKYNQDGLLIEERAGDTKTSYVYNFF